MGPLHFTGEEVSSAERRESHVFVTSHFRRACACVYTLGAQLRARHAHAFTNKIASISMVIVGH